MERRNWKLYDWVVGTECYPLYFNFETWSINDRPKFQLNYLIEFLGIYLQLKWQILL